MPLSSGLSIHDDTKHKGSAKRKTAGGVAAINGAGELVTVGPNLRLARDISEQIGIKEDTSGNIVLRFTRSALNDFKAELHHGGAYDEILLDSDKDVANGVAGLDASAEITSRLAYEDVVNGVAGLDANVLLSSALLPPCMEEYKNHLGAVDNFTQTGTAGTGSVNPDAANHEMDLNGGGGVGHARFETKDAWVLGTNPTVINILIQNIVNGAGGAKVSFIGCKVDFTDTSVLNSMGFRQIDGGSWQAVSGDASAEEVNAITALSNGDLVSILATSSSIRFFVNGTLVETHTTRIPVAGVKLGGSVDHTFGSPSPARQLSIDMMGETRYL